jgi:hypothetical protein
MLLDYIYLIIIIALLLIVIFLIYLSYEYRVFNVTESFEITTPLTFNQPNPNIESNISNIINQYSDTIVESNNQQNNSLNSELNNLLIQFQNNYGNSSKLLESKKGLALTPTTFPVNEVIKTIKSNYNSQYLSLVINDPTKYGIMLNDKCLTVSGACPNGSGICIEPCQTGIFVTDTQKFYPNRIYASADAAKLMGVSENKISSKNIYPFNIFRSNVNDKCLSMTDEGLTLEKCNLNSLSQQWAISPNENICVLN